MNPDYSNLVNDNGTIKNTATGQAFSSPDALAQHLGIPSTQIQWQNIPKASPTPTAPTPSGISSTIGISPQKASDLANNLMTQWGVSSPQQQDQQLSNQFAPVFSSLQNAQNAGTQQLEIQKKAALAQAQQNLQGTNQSAVENMAALRNIGGISSEWAAMYNTMQKANADTLSSISSQYDSAISSLDYNTAQQMSQAYLQQISQMQSLHQQAVQNAQNAFSSALSLLSGNLNYQQQQQQQQTAEQQFQAQYGLQEQQLQNSTNLSQEQLQMQKAQNAFSVIQQNFQGVGWDNISSSSQKQLEGVMQQLGLPASTAQSIADNQSVSNWSTVSDSTGSYMVGVDAQGKMVSKIKVAGAPPASSSTLTKTQMESVANANFGQLMQQQMSSTANLIQNGITSSGVSAQYLSPSIYNQDKQLFTQQTGLSGAYFDQQYGQQYVNPANQEQYNITDNTIKNNLYTQQYEQMSSQALSAAQVPGANVASLQAQLLTAFPEKATQIKDMFSQINQ